MRPSTFVRQLTQDQLLSSEQEERILNHERQRPQSVYGLLRALLYASLSAFVSGVGWLIYEHIDTIGHAVLIGLLSVIVLVGFGYVFRSAAPFSRLATEQPSALVSPVLLVSCLLFLALEGYVQYQYAVFGTRYGLATLLPALLFMGLAYRFDHTGVLSLGLSALASWVGLTVAPIELLQQNDFGNPAVIHSALIVGGAYGVVAYLSKKQFFKPHFGFTYVLLGGLLYVSASLGGLFTQSGWEVVYFGALAVGCWVLYLEAKAHTSYLFLMISVGYGYIGFTYFLFSILSEDAAVLLGSLYAMLSAGGIIWFLLKFKQWLRP
jgi:hypothetical protein